MVNNNFEKQYKIGFPIFKKMFDMPYPKLLIKLKELCGEKINNKYILNSGKVAKILINDVPSKIEISFYDSITINAFGISFTPEVGGCTKKIIDFNKYFTF